MNTGHMNPRPHPNPSSRNQGLESIKEAIRMLLVVLKFGMVVLVLAFCFSGVKYLEQYEKGILLRFGEVSGSIKEDPGMVFTLPYPIDEFIKIPAKRTQTLHSKTFWYSLTDHEQQTGTADSIPVTLKPGVDGYLVTADRSIIHVQATTKYRIRDPVNFTFKSIDVEALIRACLDNVLLKVVSQATVEHTLNNKNQLAQEITSNLANQLHHMGVGIEIDPVDVQLSWPRQLLDGINAVATAKQNYEQAIASANVYARSQKDLAESQGYKVQFEADTWATHKVSRAVADAKTFKKLYPLFKKSPNVIRQTLYQDRMKRIMANVDEIFIIEQSGNREIRINLQRKENQKKDDDKS